jgi:DNA-binding CsgD family transcriptional regulator
VTGIRDKDVEEYQVQWRPIDRVFAAVVESGAPARAQDLYPGDLLVRDPLYTGYGRRVDIYYYMSAPVFGARGKLSGVLNFARSVRDRPFTNADLRLAGTFAGFLSATLARVRAEQNRASAIEVAPDNLLTERERQVASLAASGHNNVEIALCLGMARETVKQTLRRAYRKLGVNGRAQMAAKLALSGLLVR